MILLDFEEPVRELYLQLEKAEQIAKETEVDMSGVIAELHNRIRLKREEILANLTPWQRVQLSRHPERPYTLSYIEALTNGDFLELHGDRQVRDDKAMVGGFGSIDGRTVMFIGQQKGTTTKLRQYRNFGMANPEGYRKALRMMKLAEKFNKPIVTFLDTPGAYPGLEAEERGQGEAIARNIYEMFGLRVPVICIVIGEGASGGAIGIGVGDRVLMLENTWYSVISPENCSSILWRSWEQKQLAATALKLTATDMLEQKLIDGIIPVPIGVGDRVLMLENTWYSVISPENCSSILWRSWEQKQLAATALKLTATDMLEQKLIDGIIPEPVGGAHLDPQAMFATVKQEIVRHLAELDRKSPDELVYERMAKFSAMGSYIEE